MQKSKCVTISYDISLAEIINKKTATSAFTKFIAIKPVLGKTYPALQCMTRLTYLLT